MNLDGGHYFLTVMSPVQVDPWKDAAGRVTSPTSSLREVLATLPTAAQSAACVAGGRESPFSRCQHTHFARFVVIDQPAFNGRVPVDSIVDAIRKTDLLADQHVDNVSTAWLLWAVDFDPGADRANDPDGSLHDYLVNLWNVMGAELAAVYLHCYGFEAVKNGEDFARYIRRCQVETTMPFNDYWITPPPLPTISLARIGIAIGVFTLAMTVLVACKAGWWGLVALALSLALSGYVAYRYILGRGARPFATAPNSDLRTVLKSLYLQQQFARFAIAQQGVDPVGLHAAFGRFVDEHQPSNLAQPSQAPGVIQS